MNEIKIRPAALQDLDTLLRFEQDLIATERPFDPTLKKEQATYYDLEEMIRAPHILLLVAEFETQLIGSGYLRIEPAKPYLDHTERGYLGFMYVLPAWRGKSVNKQVIDELKKWGRSKGLTELRLDAYYVNENAIRAYEKAGFTRHMVHMRMGLGEE